MYIFSDFRNRVSTTYTPLRALSFPVNAMVKNPPANSGDTTDMSSVPGLGRSLGGEHGNPLQDSCLENPMDRGAWWATVHRVKRVGHDL